MPPSMNLRVIGLNAFSRLIFPSSACRIGILGFIALTLVSHNSRAAVSIGHSHPFRSPSLLCSRAFPRAPSLQERHFSSPIYTSVNQLLLINQVLATYMVGEEGSDNVKASFDTSWPFIWIVPRFLYHPLSHLDSLSLLIVPYFKARA